MSPEQYDMLVCIIAFFGGCAVSASFYLYYRRMFTKPLAELVGALNEFSVDPTVLRPAPIVSSASPSIQNAAAALAQLQASTLRELRQRERLADLGFGVAQINHDIRHSISTGMLVMDRVLEVNDPRIKRAATIVKHSLKNAEELCDTLTNYIIEPQPPNPVEFEPNLELQKIAEHEEMDITYEGPATLCLDPAMIKRMFQNLAANAKKARASKLTVTVWRAGRLGVIDVEDNGQGIPDAARENLFRAFRGSNDSTGLGLSIVRDLAVAQGGNIRLTRSEQGMTEFRIHLPGDMFI